MCFRTKISMLLLALFIGAGVFSMSVQPAEAASLAELQQYIEQLKIQIAELQAKLKLAQQQQPTEWCHTFNVNLRIGDSGADVRALEIALVKQGFSVTEHSSNFSAVFDEKMASSVVGFQEKYKKEVLSQWRLKHGTGFVGKSTRAKLNKLYGCGITPVKPVIPEPVEPVGECNTKCQAKGYDKGICRSWAVVPSAEWGCKDNELNIGQTSDCTTSATVNGIEEIIVGVGKTCCCQKETQEEGNLPPVIDGLTAPTQLRVNEKGVWTIKARDPENGVLSYSVNWGDEYKILPESGASELDASSQTTTFTHSYAQAGTYTIRFTVTDDKQQTAKTSTTIKIGGSEITCTDSDGGINKYVRGRTCRDLYTLDSSSSDPTTTSSFGRFCRTDKCVYSPNAFEETAPAGNIDTSSQNYVIEYYCNNGRIFSSTLYCENGCADGACKRVASEYGKPYCGAIGSRSEGWYHKTNSGTQELIRWDNCDGCFAECKAIGSKSEGWYSSGSCETSGKLIKYDNCGQGQEEPLITVTSPNGGEQWAIGETRDITWTSSGVDTVLIEIDKENQGWHLAYNVSASLGKYSWKVDMDPASNYKIKIIGQGEAAGIEDASDNYFSIVAAGTSVCTDSDGGINQYVKGTACKALVVAGEDTMFCRTDKCIPLQDGDYSGTGMPRYLTEYYCKDGKIFSKTIQCADGCVNGACVGEPEHPVCGNGVCETEKGETGFTCPSDCCVHGDGVCREGCTSANDNDCEELTIDKAEIVNFLEHYREKGFGDENGAAFYVMAKTWLQLPIENKQEIIDYLDSLQRDDGAWGYLDGRRQKAVTFVLPAYLSMNAMPKKSLDPFFDSHPEYTEWEAAIEYPCQGTNDCGCKYHLVLAYISYYGKLPPWIDEFFPYCEQDISWTINEKMHQRTHILYTYLYAVHPYLNHDEMIDAIIRLQQPDGSWIDYTYDTPKENTGTQLLFIAGLKLLYPDRADDLQVAVEKSKPYVMSTYKTITEEDKILGYFRDGNTAEGILAAVCSGLVEGDASPLDPFSGSGSVCGNDICETGEDGFTCPQDCCVHGDGICREGCTSVNDNDCEEEVINKTKILNYVELKRTSDGGYNSNVFDTSFGFGVYGIFGEICPDPDGIIKFFDSTQADDGSWGAGEHHWGPNTAQALMIYKAMNVAPAKSLDKFFEKIDTWDEVVDFVLTYSKGNFWGGFGGLLGHGIPIMGKSRLGGMIMTRP